MLDLIIKNATVFTGKNELPTQTHVGIKNDKIEIVTDNLDNISAQQIIDAEGLFLSPGFIDPHASTGFGYFFPRAADHKLYQGITTEIFGNCGTSPAPIGEHLVPTMEKLSNDIGFPFTWRTTTEYFEAIEDKLQFNIATLVGHSTLRGGNLEDWNTVSDAELSRMKLDLEQAMDEGSLGMSTGLIYAPGCFADLNELVELTKVVKAKGGVYASHIRNERDKIEEAVEEALTIGRAADIDVLVSHLKAAEQRNWGKIPKVLEMIENYNVENGRKAVVDVYPYTAVSTKLRAFIPKYILKDGIAAVANKVQQPSVIADIATHIKQQGFDLSQMLIISNDFPDFFGKNVVEIADLIGKSTAETVAHLLAKSTEMWIVYHCINPNDMDAAIQWKEAMICTDSWSYPINAPKIIGHPHPRSYGAFTEYLERYVISKKMLSWQEAIHKITDKPARFFKLKNRGRIEKGYFADILLFNPNEVKANATYLNPKQLSSGMHYVFVNGKAVIANGEIQNHKTGRVLTL